MTTTDLRSFRQAFQAELFGGLAAQVARLSWSADAIRAHQQSALRRLLGHAARRSPFHARRLRGVDPDHFELRDLASLPIMTKAEMMAAFDDVVTDRRLSLARVEETLARTGDAPIPLDGEFLCQTSGGSSGRRGVFVLDRAANLAFASSMIRGMVGRSGAGGTSPSAGFTIGFVGAASAVHPTGIPPRMMEGSPIRFVPAPATLPLDEIVERLNAVRPDALFGYPSMLVRLAAEKDAGRLRIAPRVVRSTSETLSEEHRRILDEGFGVPVIDTFGSSEGLIGSSEPGGRILTFASDGCIVEPVDAENRPVPVGTPSAKILVTNLSNLAQPLIRYVIEDVFVREPDVAQHGHLRATVQGRTTDVFRWADLAVHPLVLGGVLIRFPEIADYQVRQTARGADIALLASAPVDERSVAERLTAALAAAGLADPAVTVRVVPNLERLPGTGKLRRFFPA